MTHTDYRKGIMQDFGRHVQMLGAIRQGQAGTPADMLARATVIQQLTMMLPGAFATNEIGEGSRALPAIWADAPGFAARVQAIQEAAGALVEAAQGGNAEAVATATQAFQGTCGACHSAFRGPAPN